MPESEKSARSALLHATMDPAAFAKKSEDHHIADVVEALNALDPGLAASVLEAMPMDRVTDILEQPGFDRPQELIGRLPLDRAADFVGAMSADRRADIFRRLSDPMRARLSACLEAPIRASVQQLLAYPPTSAGRIMTTEFISMPADWTVERALQHIRAGGWHEGDSLCPLYR
jgi:magnesium transporter